LTEQTTLETKPNHRHDRNNRMLYSLSRPVLDRFADVEHKYLRPLPISQVH